MARVVIEVGEAAAGIAAGHDVVLILAPGEEVPPHLLASGPGRLALLIGDPDDPSDLEAATEMVTELFEHGTRPGRRPGPRSGLLLST